MILTRPDSMSPVQLAPGVEVHPLANGEMGAKGLATALVTLRPGARFPYHTHPCGEVITVLEGEVRVLAEGRRYVLCPHDSIHVPAGTAHSVENALSTVRAQIHGSFSSDAPTREFVADTFTMQDRDSTDAGCPEQLTRFEQAPVYELAPRAFFRDLFARRLGSRGVCGGHGVFEPGASLPCHFHVYDESITIISGIAVCQVAGQEFTLSNNATACIPRGKPHRFINRAGRPMAMIWVYAGDEPERTLVDPGFCEGTLEQAQG